MTTPRSHGLLRAGNYTEAADTVCLTYDARFIRRKKLVSDGGTTFHVDLGETVSLNDGDGFTLQDGRVIRVVAAEEPLLEITGPGLPRLAWHIGNRHTPCQIGPDRLLIRVDHVLEHMLRGLGADICPVSEPFLPEGGAYGHGRTMGHSHDAEAHAASEGHGHSHAEAHSHSHNHTHGEAHEHGHSHAEAHSHADGHAQNDAHDHSQVDAPVHSHPHRHTS
ncbi:urease accessory protein [Roseicitreum antarcticum]|uniref:Urease accessory protein UreE n=1 Tax=Roseicitreum antarcticum TaxID=564137 RepID=A0A1H3BDM7_9RHOB|nr:urease accessory protein UreE [Roseicitreum antarcticum]SDX40037.1 urease accessory protein [Roseicitreum antarcticum]